MTFPRLAIIQSGGNPLIAMLYRLRIYLATIITRLLPQPMAALLIAIVLSLRAPDRAVRLQSHYSRGTGGRQVSSALQPAQ